MHNAFRRSSPGRDGRLARILCIHYVMMCYNIIIYYIMRVTDNTRIEFTGDLTDLSVVFFF